jgi:hypothetical protein
VNTSVREGRSVTADLVFWGVVSVLALIFLTQLSAAWGVPRQVLLGISAVIGASAVVGLLVFRRTGPPPRRLIRSFGITNLVMTPVLVVIGLAGILGLTAAGNLAIAAAGAATLLLGAWQVAESRTSAG